MNETLKNIIIIIVIGLVGWFGLFVVIPILFTATLYIVGFVVISVAVVGIIIWIKEFLNDTNIKSMNINKNTTSSKTKFTDNSNSYNEEKDEEEIYTVQTYVDLLPSVELEDVSNGDELYLVIEERNNTKKDAIVVYSRYWYKIGYCNENLSKILIKSINKGINYVGTVLEVNKCVNGQLELKIRVSKTLYNHIEDKNYEELESTFITTVVGVTFDNRQDVISTMKSGDKLILTREIENSYDNNAIAIYNSENMQVGYCKKELAKSLAVLMDNGTNYDAEVMKIKGGGEVNFGVDIKITKSTSSENRIIEYKDKPVINGMDKSEQIIAQLAITALERSDINNPNYKRAVRETLKVKLNRVNGDQELYIESLKKNILYYENMLEDTENLVSKWFDSCKIPDREEYLKEFFIIQENNKISNLDNAKNKHLLSKFELITSTYEKIDELEFSYTYYSGHFDIWVEYMGLIVANPNMVAPLFDKESNTIVEDIRRYCYTYTNLKLGNLFFKYKS